MTANTGGQSGGTGFQRFSPEDLERNSAPPKAQSSAPQTIRNPGEQKAAPPNLPDGEASLKAPAPVAPFDAGELRPREPEAKSAPKPPEPLPREQETQPEEKKAVADASQVAPQVAPQPEPVAPKAKGGRKPKKQNLDIPATSEDVKGLLPTIEKSWWDCPADGKGARIKLCWREDGRKKVFVFPRVSKTELETWRKLTDDERKEAIFDRLESAARLAERPDAAARLRNAIANTKAAG